VIFLIAFMAENFLFTSESVGEGHPDKVCDQISDLILDYFISKDPESRVAAECFVKNNFVLIGGEITSKSEINEKEIDKITRELIKDLGYTKDEYGFNGNCDIKIVLSKQSPDIALGVNGSSSHEQGAGDQGLMFGFACDETHEFLPLPISLSHKIMKRLSEIRRSGKLDYLRPDAKCQVTIEYESNKPKRAHTIVLSAQHDPDISNEKIKEDLIKQVIKPVCGRWIDKSTIFHINPTGKFIVGGPAGDTGLTGRKIIVDTYGGYSRHGGGCFSGKDPSKVDRSAAYAARYIAKNIV
jgi:S-adenosylmethionine synthetase